MLRSPVYMDDARYGPLKDARLEDTRYDLLKEAKFLNKEQDMAYGQIIVEARQYGAALLRQHPDALFALLPEQRIVSIFSKYFIADDLNEKTRALNSALQLPTEDDADEDLEDRITIETSSAPADDAYLFKQFSKALSKGAVQEYLDSVEPRGYGMAVLLNRRPEIGLERVTIKNRFSGVPFIEVFAVYDDARGKLVNGITPFLRGKAGEAAQSYRLSFRSKEQYDDFEEKLCNWAFGHVIRSVDSYDPRMNVKFSSFIGNQVQLTLHGMAKKERNQIYDSFDGAEQLSAKIHDTDDDDSLTFEDIAQASVETSPERGILYEQAVRAMKELSQREQDIIIRNILQDEELHDVAKHYGISYVRARQLKKHALRRLRAIMGVKGAQYLP
jgi:RNA polymerase sigma factor (sigma-70 family)